MESAEGRRDLRPETSTRKHEWNVRSEQENVFWWLIGGQLEEQYTNIPQ